MKLTRSLFCSTAFSLSSSSQSVSLMSTNIPGRKLFCIMKNSNFLGLHFVAKCSMSSLILISLDSKLICSSFWPSKQVSKPPPKSTNIFIKLILYMKRQLKREREINFAKFCSSHKNNAIHLTFSPQPQEEQLTLNLKTDECSVPNLHSFLTDNSNCFDTKIGYYSGSASASDPYDFYLISKADLLKLLTVRSMARETPTAQPTFSRENKENRHQFVCNQAAPYASVQKLNQPLPSRQRSQTHFHHGKFQ